MTSGRNHDRIILYSAPVITLCSHWLTPGLEPLVGASYLLGGLYLSPDLDTVSRPFHRWGVLKLFWFPYQKVCKHRGSSHWVGVGTLARVLYLLLPLLLCLALLNVDVTALILQYQREWLVAFVGLELSAWAHLAGDGILFR